MKKEILGNLIIRNKNIMKCDLISCCKFIIEHKDENNFNLIIIK